MSDPAVDVIVPYWGDPGLLRETVTSVLAQDDPRWFLTVVDDAYPDPAAGEWVRALAERDPRVRYVRKEVNEGITAAFRTCAAMATRDVVAIPGSDDVLLPGYVATVLAAFADHPGASIVQPGVEVIDERGEVVAPLADRVKQRLVRPRADGPRLLGGERLAASLLRGNWMYWPSLAFRREALQAFDFRDELELIQDLGLVLDMVGAGHALLLEPTVCFRYRRHGGSASNADLLDGRRFAGERAYFAAAAAQMAQRGWPRAARAARWHWTSRLNALSLLPVALRRRRSVGMLLRHAVGR